MALPREVQARRQAKRLSFKLVDDPVEFVSKVGKLAKSPNHNGHVVVAPATEDNDYAVCARIAAVIMGAWYTDASSFIKYGRTCGCQYKALVRQSKFQFAVSIALGKCYPSIMLLMRAIANVLAPLASCTPLWET